MIEKHPAPHPMIIYRKQYVKVMYGSGIFCAKVNGGVVRPLYFQEASSGHGPGLRKEDS
jgi:hypothetical protein